jgi:putative ABC transport system permease protein
LGFDPEQVITIPIQNDALKTNYETVRKELEALPGVVSVSASGNQPGGSDWGIPSLAEGFTNDNMPPTRVMAVDPGFIETFGMEIVSGRGFSSDFASDSGAYLINEEAARQFAWADPLGKTISMPAISRPAGPVVGVVKDFHFRSMREKIGPLLFFMPPAWWYSQYSIKIDAANTQDILKAIENKWTQFDPGHPFTFSFFDDGYSQLYQQENRLGQIVNYFTIVGILLSCLGLYSLASLTTQQRTKEIGIRKAIGATSRQIVMMLSKQYLLLVVMGFVIALPAALWISDKWLASFAYRDDFNALLIVAGCCLSVLVALLTVGYRSWRAAKINPVVSLRNE